MGHKANVGGGLSVGIGVSSTQVQTGQQLLALVLMHRQIMRQP